jgi:hypothetical protein
LDLGQYDGTNIDNVALPAWGKRPIDFIYLQRKGLECDFVSQHIASWIHLRWGYKQRVMAALEAKNTFDHELPDDTETTKMVTATMEQYGQIPIQMRCQAHPQKLSLHEREAINYACDRPSHNPLLFVFVWTIQQSKSLIISISAHGVISTIRALFHQAVFSGQG